MGLRGEFFKKAEERISELKEKKFLEQSMEGQKIENTEERDVVRRSNIYFNWGPRRKEENVQKEYLNIQWLRVFQN